MTQTWEKHVVWPACETCRATGVMTDPKTQWPVECTRCIGARKGAIKKAQAVRRKELKDA